MKWFKVVYDGYFKDNTFEKIPFSNIKETMEHLTLEKITHISVYEEDPFLRKQQVREAIEKYLSDTNEHRGGDNAELFCSQMAKELLEELELEKKQWGSGQ